MKTTTKLRLFSLSGKHLYSKQDAILVFNPQAHRVLKLFYLQTNKKTVISKCLGATTEKEADPYLKNMLQTSQLGGYYITHKTSNLSVSIIIQTVYKGL